MEIRTEEHLHSLPEEHLMELLSERGEEARQRRHQAAQYGGQTGGLPPTQPDHKRGHQQTDAQVQTAQPYWNRVRGQVRPGQR